MNDPKVKAQLDVRPDLTFETCNTEVNQASQMQGDAMHNSGALLEELIDGGVRLLVYAGNAGACICDILTFFSLFHTFCVDMMCNYIVSNLILLYANSYIDDRYAQREMNAGWRT